MNINLTISDEKVKIFRTIKKIDIGAFLILIIHVFGLAVTPPPPERMTPVKHALPHVIARFSPGGQLIKVLPNVPSDGMPAVVEIHNIEVRVNICRN